MVVLIISYFISRSKHVIIDVCRAALVSSIFLSWNGYDLSMFLLKIAAAGEMLPPNIRILTTRNNATVMKLVVHS
jgi:hypothetical protein